MYSLHVFSERPDVVVAGFGVAGATAALAAQSAGARVLVVEKTSAGGGNCLNSGGFLFSISGERAIEHLDAVCFGRTDRTVLEAYAAGTGEVASWIESLGGQTSVCDPAAFGGLLPSWPNFPGAAECVYRQFDGGQTRPGIALWQLVEHAVHERGIEVALDTAVADLVVQDGAVRGAILDGDGGRRTVSADAVVIASGGIEHDAELRDTYLSLPLTPVGHPGNTGDSVRLAQRAGASLWHMAAYFGWLAHPRPDFPAAFTINVHAPTFVFVDEDGRRFADETGWEVHDQMRSWTTFMPRHANRPRARGYVIFDEAARLAGPLNGIVGTPNDYRWSADNSAELDAGWIVGGDTADAGRSRRRSTSTPQRSPAVVTSSSTDRRRRSPHSKVRCTP